MTTPAPIAVIGMACRLPGGASSPEGFWDLLSQGGSGRTEVPADRWNRDAFQHSHSSEVKESMPVKHGYFLQEDISKFDARFFNIFPSEARAIDPQQRILLETTYEAIENAGIPIEKIRGSDTSVFVGVFCRDYDRMGYKDLAEANKFHVTGSGDAMVANRISYLFDLKGASVTLDTGCSGSLVALHQACQSLRLGESNIAIVGGSQLIITPDQSVMMSAVGMINKDGYCYTFDDRGDGYARGEGVATIILKPLDQAIADGDNIHSVIVNSGVNQDGKTNGIMLPNGDAQAALIRSVYAGVGLDPGNTLYIEAHGTGTKAGDKTEIGSINKVFCEESNRNTDLIIGSVKTNIGHLEATSGLAGFLKSTLVLQHRAVPPNLNFVTPKETIHLDKRKIKIPTELTALPGDDSGVLRVSVNSYGYGGTNCHVILESAPKQVHINGAIHHMSNGITNGYQSDEERSCPQLFLLSAASEKSLAAIATNLAGWIAAEQPDETRLQDLAYTLAEHRSLLPWRRGIVASDAKQLTAELAEMQKTKPKGKAAEATSLTFVFTGQGAQWHAMGRELLSDSWRFRESIDKSERLLRSFGCTWDLVQELCKEDSSTRLDEAELSQPVTTALQIALVDVLTSLGVSPSRVIGHSSGEIAAAYTAGAMSHEDAIEVAYRRGLCSALAQTSNAVKGSMIAVGLGEHDVQPYLQRLSKGLATVACANSPESTTVSGDEAAIDELKALLDDDSVFARKLKVETAYHSHHMETVAEAYLKSLSSSQESDIPNSSVKFYSTAHGIQKLDAFSAEYWTHNLVSKVQFSDTLQLLWQDIATSDPNSTVANIFVEIGPHAALAGPVRQTLSRTGTDPRYTYLPSLTRKQDATRTLLALVSRLMELGHSPVNAAEITRMSSQNRKSTKSRVVGNIKPYAWDQSQFWRESRVSREHRFRKFPHHDLVGLLDPSSIIHEPRWKHFLDLDALPWLKDHVIDGFIVFPGAGYLCMAIEGMKQLTQLRKTPGTVSRYVLKNVAFSQSIVFPRQTNGPVDPIEVQLALSPSGAHQATQWQDFRIFSHGQDDVWSEHSTGMIKAEITSKVDEVDGSREEEFQLASDAEYLQDIQDHCTEELSPGKFYDTLRTTGNDYGPLFAIVDKIWMGTGQSWATFKVPEIAHAQPHVMHPTTFDAIYQVGAVLFKRFGSNAPVVPTTTGSIIIEADLLSRPGDEIIVGFTLTPDERGSSATYNFTAYQRSADGHLVTVARCSDGVMRAVGEIVDEEPEGPYSNKMAYRMAWDVDVDLATRSALADAVTATAQIPTAGEIAYNHYVEQAASIYLRQALEVVESQSDKVESEHLRQLLEWTKNYCKSRECHDLLASITLKQEQIIMDCSEQGGDLGRTLARIGRNLPHIFLGKLDPQTLLPENKLSYEAYATSDLTANYNQMAELVRLLAFKNPQMAVLEIGAGSGSATVPVLEALTKEDGQISVRQYTYTDVSDGLFKTSEQTLEKWQGQVDFKMLDIEKDPFTQGYAGGSYDVIIASNALHATSDIDVTMENVRKLLKPGGRLILIEQFHTTACMQTVFGTLPGWWSFKDDRSDSPLLSAEQWNSLLLNHAFSGLDFTAPNHVGKTSRSSLIVSKAVDSMANGASEPVKVVMVGGVGFAATESLAANLANALGRRGIEASRQAWSDLTVDQETTYMVLSPAEEALFVDADPLTFANLKNLLSSGARVLWIGLQESESRQNSAIRGMIKGLARVVRRENSDPSKLIILEVEDTTQAALGDDLVESVINVADKCLWHTDNTEGVQDREYMYRHGKLIIPRLQTDSKFFEWVNQSQNTSSTAVATAYHQANRPLKLVVKTPGMLGSLHFDDATMPTESLAPGEIEVSARAHGVNFKDVFIALGQMLPGVKMVGEVAGIVTAVGADMAHLHKVGDRVVATGGEPFASRSRIPGLWAQKIPDSISFSLGASIPTIYMTAYYCMVEIARMEKGQSILIHAASGGVGQAAIQLAQHIGIEIFATVGSPAKRQLLMDEYGIRSDHIFSTRTGTFKKSLLRITQDRGVDVVLNSLAGESLSDGWECVARLGKFIEIGKADIYNGSYLPMTPFDKSITFAAMDLIAVRETYPEKLRAQLGTILDLFDKGVLRPVNRINTLPIGSLQEGFRLIESRKHMGKIVLEAPEDAEVQATVPKVLDSGPKLKKAGTYVIAGGLGDLGRRIARLFASRGAGHIVTLSRRTPDAATRMALEKDIKEYGGTLHIVRCDVSDESDIQKTVEYCANLPPVRGVIHCGMVLKDRPFINMPAEDFAAALKPKVHGTVNLDRAFASSSLDFFVMLSSVASILGNLSQANYAAANSFQDSFASADHPNTQYISINLGAIAGSEAVSDPVVEAALARSGVLFLTAEELLKSIEYVISPKAKEDGCVQLVTGFTRESLLGVGNTASANEALLIQLPVLGQKDDGTQAKDTVEQSIRKAQHIAEAENLITEAIMAKFAGFLDKPPSDIVASESLKDMGLDSLVSIELKNWMARTFQMSLHTAEMTNAPSIFALAKLVVSRSKLISESQRNAAPPTETDQAKVAEPKVTNGDNGTKPANGPNGTHGAKLSNGANGTHGTKIPVRTKLSNNVNGKAGKPLSTTTKNQYPCCKAAGSLPRHPLVPFDDAIEKLEQDLLSVAQTERELIDARHAIRELSNPDGFARQVYQQLAAKANDPNCDSWLADTVLKEGYLKQRTSLAPGGNYLTTHLDDKVPHSQAERASLIARAAFSFCEDIETGTITTDSLEGKTLCTDSWRWLFNTVREPQVGCDEMKRYPGNHHCAVLRRGHLFNVPLAGKSRHQLQLTFEAILDHVDDEGSWTGALTTDNRDSWARNRQELIGLDQTNKDYFHVIETAVFVLSLDDTSPANRLEKVEQSLLRTTFNRWHDKSVQFVVFANGQSAAIYEHSLVDGLTTLRLAERIDGAIRHGNSLIHNGVNVVNGGRKDSVTQTHIVELDELTIKTTPSIEMQMTKLRDEYREAGSSRTYAHYETDLINRDFLFTKGAPIKGCVDIAIQLALRLHFGTNPPAFQAISTQHFHRGRPEAMQLVTKSVLDFCTAATNDSIPLNERRSLLIQAAKECTAREREVAEGKGYGFVMAAVHATLPDGSALKNNPIWSKIVPWGLKALQGIKTDNIADSAGMHPSWDPEAVWTSYTVGQKSLGMSIVGPVDEIEHFQECMDAAADTIRTLLKASA